MSDRDPRPAPGAPRLPRDKPSWLAISYGVVGAALVVGYLLSGLLGWSFDDDERGALPAGVRQAPGGYRSYHLWHSGYQGGK